MRARVVTAMTLGSLALLASCVRGEETALRAPPRAVPLADGDASSTPEPPPQYVVGDPARAGALSVLPLGPETTGVILDGTRFVVRGGQVRASRDVADGGPLQSAWVVPKRLGGGFLFRAKDALYASDAFDGLLRPVAAFPSEVSDVWFAPRAAFVRAASGERWMVDLASGKRVAMAPAGLLEVAALDDGRAVALLEGGQLSVSTDAGDHWTDATAQLRSPAKRVFVGRSETSHDETIWVETQGAGALGLLAGGRLAPFDALPTGDPAPVLRAKPKAWREDDAPLRRALRSGAPSRDGSAMVVASGDLVQVDVLSGAVEVVAPGKLPPDATCAGTRVQDDVVFTCGRPNGPSFVVAHTLDRAPVVEQTFTEAGRFIVSDDGGVLWVGPCAKPLASQRRAACVRTPGGGWQQLDLDGAGDAGGGGPTFNLVRWIPRGDGGAIAVVSDIGGVANAWGLVDARTGDVHAWPTDALTPQLRTALQSNEGSRSPVDPARLADRSWTVTAQGTLRGWAQLGNGTGAVEVGVDGSLQTSPFTFERISSAGGIALARTREGRIWQTLDRGASWSEVAGPPAVRPSGWIDPHACSLVGCDLGQWYRIGWAPTSPVLADAPITAPPAPRIEQPAVPGMICKAAGEARRATVSADERSPDDLGLGASKLAVSDPKGITDFLRLPFPRRLVGAVRDTDAADATAARAIVHGPTTTPGETRLQVTGFNHDLMALVRQVQFVAPFDPAGSVRRAPIAQRELVAAARSAGVAGIWSDDPVPSGVVPVTPADPEGPDDLLVQLADGGVAVVRAEPGARAKTRAAYESARGEEWRVVSAVAVDGGFAWLEEDSTGQARVMKLGASPVPSAAFDLDAPPASDLYPANVDALAVGPHGELGVLRSASGGEPPSVADPAVILVPGAPPQALAPWSTLTTADDGACKADPTGWRVTVQTLGPWIRLTGSGELRGADDSFMLARLRWNARRVCLEGFELRVQDTGGSPGGQAGPWGNAFDQPTESWVVARFGAATSAGKVVVVAGGELRQPVQCHGSTP
jgi:hypothetical protein